VLFPSLLRATLEREWNERLAMFSVKSGERSPGSLPSAIRVGFPGLDQPSLPLGHVVVGDTEDDVLTDGRADARRTSPGVLGEQPHHMVAELTGRSVVSFMSDHDAETDHAAEIFILDGEPEWSPPPGDEGNALPDPAREG
jgi:hypothetical protein